MPRFPRLGSIGAAWPSGPGDLVLLPVGRLAPEKNTDLMLETLAAARAVAPGMRAVLVDDGPELSRLRRAHPQWIYAGTRVGTELAEHYASADLFLFPGLTETFGNVIPEAMATGLAVIAFDYAAAHQYIRSGVNGWTVPTEDRRAFILAATGLVRRPDEARRLGAEARRTAEALGWDRVIETVE